jgi:hypothetical protein
MTVPPQLVQANPAALAAARAAASRSLGRWPVAGGRVGRGDLDVGGQHLQAEHQIPPDARPGVTQLGERPGDGLGAVRLLGADPFGVEHRGRVGVGPAGGHQRPRREVGQHVDERRVHGSA